MNDFDKVQLENYKKDMQVKASLISQLLGGELVGNPDVLVSKPAKIEA